jgi:hypothetical protein
MNFNNQYVLRIKLRKMKSSLLLLVLASCFTASVCAQNLILDGPVAVAAPGRLEAPIDLTGNWVSVVTEDWVYRMLTPAPGDYMSVPLNDVAIEIANGWDLEADNAAGLQCKAFGAARIMRVPTRLQISWEDDYTLRIDSDAGSQTRRLNFSSKGRRSLLSMMLDGATRERSWQGYSVADWENVLINKSRMFYRPGDVAPPGGSLKVITTRMTPGYLRPNGAPYSEDAILTEFFDRLTAPTGEEWLVVTTIVDDPAYLMQPYVTTSHFRREVDSSKWNPSPCETWPPVPGAQAPRW